MKKTFQYQINSLTNTNGQVHFLSVNMYLGETDEYKEELAMIIEEFLKQRIEGMKNEKGVWITPAFPKLLYVLEEDNINPKGLMIMAPHIEALKTIGPCKIHRRSFIKNFL